jgi:uncharacterized membrane protein YoaK (UPF0700 family)
MRPLDRPRRRLAVAIATLAGFVDATGFLAAGGYFVSFMSGNTTRLAVDLTRDPARALVPAGLIAGFVAGVVLGAIAAERAGARRKTAVLALATLLLAAAAVLDHLWPAGFLAGSVLAMGALNNVFRRDGEIAVGVTYMPGALGRLGQGIVALLLGRPAEGRMSAGLLWLGLTAGGIAGAATFTLLRGVAPWIALAGAAVLLAAAWRIETAADHPSR